MKNVQLNYKYKNYLPSVVSLFLIVSAIQINAQIKSVQGKIITSRYPVINASVTFIDNADTTTKFTAFTDASGNYQIGVPTSVKENINSLPTKFDLEQSYPNPFSSSAEIPYKLKAESNVHVTIYDILGRVVKKFNAGFQRSGAHSVLWDGHNNFGQKVASGVYFYRVQVGNESQVKKMIFNESGSGLSSIPRTYSATINETNTVLKKSNSVTSYTIRLENTSTTLPIIIPQSFSSVKVQNDTTINFTVNHIPVADLELDSLRQIIRGFGASNVILWRPDMTSSEVETAFGTGNGQIGFSILRIMVEKDSARWGLYLSTLKKAQSMGATIIASPWYAPDNLVETANGVSWVKHDKYGEYAAHLNSFITFMKNNGISIYGLSVQNEPDITDQWTSWTSDEILTFMKEYADDIKGTYVMAPESFQFKRSMSDPILNDSAACANTDIICGHIYGAGLASYPLAKSKGKEVWMTEYLFGEQNSANNWSWAIKVATNMTDVMKADMSAYIWWNIVRYYGPIGDGEKSTQNPNESYPKKGEVTKKGYVMSQFSKFIRPGYYRVMGSIYPPLGTAAGVDITAYKDPVTSKVVVVAVNTSSESKESVIRFGNATSATSFTSYTTSETKNCQQGENVNIDGNSFRITLSPSSITTFISN